MSTPYFENIDGVTNYMMEVLEKLDKGEMDKYEAGTRHKCIEKIISVYKVKLAEAALSGRKPCHKFLNVQYADEQIENVKKIGETV